MMAKSDYSLPEEAIDALLHEHAYATMGDPEAGEAETQFQSLERNLDAVVLKDDRNLEPGSQARTPPLFRQDQDLMEGMRKPGNSTMTGLEHGIPWFFDHTWSRSELTASEQTPDLLNRMRDEVESITEEYCRLDWKSNEVESIAAEWCSDLVVPVSQAGKIQQWCRNTPTANFGTPVAAGGPISKRSETTMAASDYSVSEEAIDALLQGHGGTITGRPEEAEADTQFQSLQRESDALESQLIILNDAKQATRKGKFDSRAQTSDVLDLDQGLTGSIGIDGDNTGLGDRILGLVNRNWSQSGFERFEIIAEEEYSFGAVPVPQAPKVLPWCQDTIERIAKALTPDQIDQIFKTVERDFAPPWSPFTMGRIILRNRLEQRILPLEKQLAALKQQRNSQLSIARLPLETVIQVFDFLLGAEPPERRDETFVLCTVLMRICRNWTWIIQNTPSLWTRITPYSSSLKEVKMALDRSRPLPISLRFDNAQMTRIGLATFLYLITEHVDRWRALELHLIGWEAPSMLSKKFAKVFPLRLERLRVSAQLEGWWASTSWINLFEGHWPNSLNHFGLVGCRMDSSHYVKLQGLTTLELSQAPPRQEPTVAEILRILSNCPGMESLTLGGRIVLDEQTISGTALLNPGSPVQLDRLRAISLSLEPALINALLRNMQAENCTKFCIEAIQPTRTESSWTESLTDGIRSFVVVMESVLSSASAISIKIDHELIEVITDPPDSDFVVRLTFRGTGLAEVGRWLTDSLTLGPAPVKLYFAADDPAWTETLPLILSNFENIAMLTFVGLDSTYQQAIDFLGTPIHTETTGHRHFPAPRLACMDVMDEYIPDIIHMVERRQSAEVAVVGRPVKLSKLVLRRKAYGEFTENGITERLLSALPGGEVEWSIV